MKTKTTIALSLATILIAGCGTATEKTTSDDVIVEATTQLDNLPNDSKQHTTEPHTGLSLSKTLLADIYNYGAYLYAGYGDDVGIHAGTTETYNLACTSGKGEMTVIYDTDRITMTSEYHDCRYGSSFTDGTVIASFTHAQSSVEYLDFTFGKLKNAYMVYTTENGINATVSGAMTYQGETLLLDDLQYMITHTVSMNFVSGTVALSGDTYFANGGTEFITHDDLIVDAKER